MVNCPQCQSYLEVVCNDRGGVIADDYYWHCHSCGWQSEPYYYPDTIPASQQVQQLQIQNCIKFYINGVMLTRQGV